MSSPNCIDAPLLLSYASRPYEVRSPVPLSIFREFLSAVAGNDITITAANLRGLEALSDEFGFLELIGKLSEFRSSMGWQDTEDAEARRRIAALEIRANQHDRAIEALQDNVKQLSADFGRFSGEASILRSVADDLRALIEEASVVKDETAERLCEVILRQSWIRFVALQKEVLFLKKQFADLAPAPVRAVVGFADYFGDSGDFRGVP